MAYSNEEALKKAQKSPSDEYGVTHENILYNEKEDKLFSLLDAPDKDAPKFHLNFYTPHHELPQMNRGISADSSSI